MIKKSNSNLLGAIGHYAKWAKLTDRTTNIATTRLNWPRCRFSENKIRHLKTNPERENDIGLS